MPRTQTQPVVKSPGRGAESSTQPQRLRSDRNIAGGFAGVLSRRRDRLRVSIAELAAVGTLAAALDPAGNAAAGPDVAVVAVSGRGVSRADARGMADQRADASYESALRHELQRRGSGRLLSTPARSAVVSLRQPAQH